jgi:hypothetical protein
VGHKFSFVSFSEIQEEIKRGFNSGNACYHSVQNMLSSRLLSKNIRITIYKSIILPVFLYGCENYGRAVAQRLDAGFPPRRPGFAYV